MPYIIKKDKEYGGVNANTAGTTSYNNSTSGLSSRNVQDAIDELAEGGGGGGGDKSLTFDTRADYEAYEASAEYDPNMTCFIKETSIADADQIKYDNSTSGLEATNLQDAVDELNDRTVNVEYATAPCSILISDIHFYKRNGVIFIRYTTNTIASVAAGDLGVVGTIPEGFEPFYDFSLVNYPTGSAQIQFSFFEDGRIKAYNYGSALTAARACRFHTSYLAKTL